LPPAGSTPNPRLVFALWRGPGTGGRGEVVEWVRAGENPPAEIHERLARQAPAGLDIHTVRRIDPKAGAQVRRVCYCIPLPPECRAETARRIDEIMASVHCRVERLKPQPRQVDVRPYLRGLHLLPDALEMDLWVTPNGTARPDELLALLGLGGLLEAGAVLERTTLELVDEVCASEPGPREEVTAEVASPDSSASLPHSSESAAPVPHD